MSAQLDELLAEQQKLQENLAAKVRHSSTDSRIGSRMTAGFLGYQHGEGGIHTEWSHTQQQGNPNCRGPEACMMCQ